MDRRTREQKQKLILEENKKKNLIEIYTHTRAPINKFEHHHNLILLRNRQQRIHHKSNDSQLEFVFFILIFELYDSNDKSNNLKSMCVRE
jgi:hypothetical protein